MKNINTKHEILLGLTTTPGSDWRGKIEEMKKYGIKRIALFPTFLKIDGRRELYKLLEQIEGLEIPHVHLRDDMEKWELDLFEKKYHTQLFNVHMKHISVPLYAYLLPKIYVENHFCDLPAELIEKCSGICLDASHLESSRIMKRKEYAQIMKMLDSYKVGCCHISAIKTNRWNLINWKYGFSRHSFVNLKELDYVKKYVQYLPHYLSLELENTFSEQLEAKKYLEEQVLKDMN